MTCQAPHSTYPVATLCGAFFGPHVFPPTAKEGKPRPREGFCLVASSMQLLLGYWQVSSDDVDGGRLCVYICICVYVYIHARPVLSDPIDHPFHPPTPTINPIQSNPKSINQKQYMQALGARPISAAAIKEIAGQPGNVVNIVVRFKSTHNSCIYIYMCVCRWMTIHLYVYICVCVRDRAAGEVVNIVGRLVVD